MNTPSKTLEPFRINISDEVRNDLRARLKATRFAPDLDNEDMSYGLSTTYMKELVDHWLNKFDWKKSEREINAFNQHRIEVEGTPVHFIYERGKGSNPTPIILSHGWPWTFWMWSKVIRQLADPASFGGDPKRAALARLGEVHVDPAGEAILEVPRALAVAQQDERGHGSPRLL